ncbi:zinc transport system permease protein [Allocatelliglobosispora scoriae]|uniref:Zinc transport system permease protein n=1 Tax=Allocatelliglobosispora scoriae TaxID=643052 RepID=A0A841BRB9_9ACTN|nr:metal ABC transporter permease [Allocatelliglobosispora scoriae]MBB5869739.1 zinc transport system permease protein [Allocatelliglobosispora scoriae]
MNIFSYAFMQHALIGAAITGLTAPALGIYLVQRRLSLIGDGIGHVALTGVGVGLLVAAGQPRPEQQRSAILWAVIIAALGATAVELIRQRSRTSGDIALAILFYGGISGGVFLIALSKTNANLSSYLFGSPLTITTSDLWTMVILGAVVLAVGLGLRPWLFAICQDEEYATVAGLPVRTLNLVLAITTAVMVTTAMRAVGLLLVSALMVVPVAAAQLVTRGFGSTMGLAMVFGLVSGVAGIVISGPTDTAPGATVVLVAIALFIIVAVCSAIVRSARRRRGGQLPAECEPPEVVLTR